MSNENAVRFLRSYNNIESRLKSLYNAKPTQNFTDLVKRCSDLNITVRRYESELVDYGKLRNAIVHRTTNMGETVIANPCDEVVQNIEFIEMLHCRPPRVTDAIKVKKIATVFADKPLVTAVETFAEQWQKTLIVYDHGTMLGIINCYNLYGEIATRVRRGENVTRFLTETRCGDVIHDEQLQRYKVVSAEATVVDVFTAFEERKDLVAVIVTENGRMGEKALTIITPTDFPRINRYIESCGVKPF